MPFSINQSGLESQEVGRRWKEKKKKTASTWAKEGKTLYSNPAEGKAPSAPSTTKRGRKAPRPPKKKKEPGATPVGIPHKKKKKKKGLTITWLFHKEENELFPALVRSFMEEGNNSKCGEERDGKEGLFAWLADWKTRKGHRVREENGGPKLHP